ncbi:MAG: coproporphyrinogen dehydrogenase HemZ [Firmicutes bacterium]|nr:coproporphyrinogen dehydrogenase HemZ [Bacillota bacterium]
MIFVQLDNESFWYDIYHIIKMFFVKEEVVLLQNSENKEEIENKDMFILVSASITDNAGIPPYLKVELKAGSYEAFYSRYLGSRYLGEGLKNPKNQVGCNGAVRNGVVWNGRDENREVKKELSRLLYSALVEYTGKKIPWGILTGIRPAKIVYEMIEEGMEESEILRRLEQYYMVSRKKARLALEVACAEKRILDRSKDNMISIYIGIPFCKSRCLYCSFTSYCITRYEQLIGKYIEVLKKEISLGNEIIREKGYEVQSIYIGGGTPTSISVKYLEDFLQFIERTFNTGSLEEFTLEAGRPDSIEEEKLFVIKNSMVDRISINPQTMNENTLKVIGRNHSPDDVRRAFYLARDMGFNNINMDVIVGLPGENLKMFENTLREVEVMEPESLTVHALAIKRASRLREEQERFSQISYEEASIMTDKAYECALSMGMRPYYMYRQKNIAGNLENVGYCKPGFESIYNVQIMEEKQTIFAFGAGAVSKVVYPCENRIERAFNVKSPEEYINRVDEMVERKRRLFKS